MKHGVFILSFLSGFFFLRSQEVKITKGEMFISQSQQEDLWIGNDSSGIYFINPASLQSNTCALYRFDTQSGNRISSKVIEFTAGVTSEIVSAKLLSNKIILFVKEESKEGKVQLYRR